MSRFVRWLVGSDEPSVRDVAVVLLALALMFVGLVLGFTGRSRLLRYVLVVGAGLGNASYTRWRGRGDRRRVSPTPPTEDAGD